MTNVIRHTSNKAKQASYVVENGAEVAKVFKSGMCDKFIACVYALGNTMYFDSFDDAITETDSLFEGLGCKVYWN